MDAEQAKIRGRKVVGLGIPGLLCCTLSVLLGRHHGLSSYGISLFLWVLGLLATVPMLLQYRTGDPKYVSIFLLSFIVPIVLLGMNLPTALSLSDSVFTIIYYAACFGLGPLLIFVLFRSRVLDFIGTAT